MALAPRSGPNLASKLGLSRPDPTTARAIESLGYELLGSPQGNDFLLGAGAYASVYYGQTKNTKRAVAIKVFHDSEDARAYFDNEVCVLERPGFPADIGPAVYGSYRFTGAQPFLVMEYIRGTHFARYCRDNKLTLEQRCQLAEQLLQGLARLHESDCAHRDLHSANVLVAANGRVRLLDFGLSAPIGARAGTVRAFGNYENTAPEVLSGKRADDADDVYSAAGLIIQALIDEPMPKNTSRSGDPLHLQECAAKLRECRIPMPLQRGLLRALGPAEQRPTAAGLAAQLVDWRQERPQRRRRYLQNALLVLAVAVACGFVARELWGMQQGLALQEYDRLRDVAAQLSHRDDPNVKPLIAEATVVAGTDRSTACDKLRGAIGLSRAIDLDSVASGLITHVNWELDAPLIAQKRQVAQAASAEGKELINARKGEEAARQLETVLSGLPSLIELNATAVEAARYRSSCQRAFESVSDRVRSLPEFRELQADADEGEAAWEDGDFANAQTLCGQAHQGLLEWLSTVETPEEAAAREGIDAVERELLIGEIRQSKVDRDAALANVTKLTDDLGKARKSEADAIAKRDMVTGERDELRAKVAPLEAEKNELATQVTGLKTKFALQEQQQKRLDGEVEDLNSDLKAERAMVASLENELVDKVDEAQRLTDQVATLTTELESTKLEVARLTKELALPCGGAGVGGGGGVEWTADFQNGIPEDWEKAKGSKFMVRNDLSPPILISNGDSGQHVMKLPKAAEQVLSDKVDWTADIEMYVFGTDRMAPTFELRIGKDLRIPVKEYRGAIEVAGRTQPPEQNWGFYMLRDLKDGCGTLRVKYSAKDKKVTVGMLRLDSGEFFEFNSTDVTNLRDRTIEVVLGAEGNTSGGMRSIRIYQ